jgi:type I restriction enzyme S subunit
LGEVYYVTQDCWPLNTALYVQDFKGNRPKFIYYFLQSLLKGMQSDKAAVPGVNRNDLHARRVKYPANDQLQKKIEELISPYDDLIENNRRRIQLLEESARLLYKEWFVHLRFPGHEHVKVVDGVPEGWTKEPLREVLTLNYGKALKSENRVPGLFPVYGSSGIVGQHNKALVEGSAIVLGRKGNVGSVYWVSSDFYPIDTVYFIKREQANLYLYFALQFTQFINTDVAVPGLNRDMAYSREILLPENSILNRFLDEVTPLQQQIEKLGDYNKKLGQARDLLLPKLMSGEIVV